jgi:hypothetical protein
MGEMSDLKNAHCSNEDCTKLKTKTAVPKRSPVNARRVSSKPPLLKPGQFNCSKKKACSKLKRKRPESKARTFDWN